MAHIAAGDLTEEFVALVLMASDHAMGSIRDSGGPLVAFLMAEDREGKVSLHRFVTERLEEAPVRIREFAGALPDTVVRVVGAWDGYITVDGSRTDAVLLEGSERGEYGGRAVQWALRYRPSSFLRKPAPVGDLMLVGDGDGLLG